MGWFSHLMKIIKIYSKIQTNDEEINQAIMAKATLWSAFNEHLMRPYDAISFRDLGSYEGSNDKSPMEYSVRSVGTGIVHPVSKKVI